MAFWVIRLSCRETRVVCQNLHNYAWFLDHVILKIPPHSRCQTREFKLNPELVSQRYVFDSVIKHSFVSFGGFNDSAEYIYLTGLIKAALALS